MLMTMSIHVKLTDQFEVAELRDEFLSEEDLDLRNLTEEELYAWWDWWLVQAQTTNDLDEHTYSHGVFTVEPGWERDPNARGSGAPTRAR